MPRIDLYLMRDSSFSARVEFCCRLVDKAFPQHSNIDIYTQDEIQNEALDDALWAFKADSFLPHSVTSDDTPHSPIGISNSLDNFKGTKNNALLIMLNKELPSAFSSYQRLCLIIPNIEHEIQEARRLYKQLSETKHSVNIHDLRHPSA